MLIDRRAFTRQTAASVAKIREDCMGCTDCKGLCRELLQMSLLPEILLERREDHA